MIEFGLLALVVVIGAFWLVAALIGVMFKLTFGVLGALFGALGALFGGMFAVFGAGVAALVMLPLLALVLLPLLIPALCVAALVWVIVHAARKPAPVRM